MCSTRADVEKQHKERVARLNPNPEDTKKLVKLQQPLYDHGWQNKRYHPEKPPIMVLVLDGGGLRGALTVQILKSLENEIKKIDPNLELKDCFDHMIGTSTGGLIALGLSKLKWNCEDIDRFYDKLGQKVFRKIKKKKNSAHCSKGTSNNCILRI